MTTLTQLHKKFISALFEAPFLLRLFLSLLSGIGLSFIQAPFDLWFLLFPCFGLFYLLYASVDSKHRTFLLSFVFGLGYFITGLNWIGNALLVEGNDYKWAWPLAVIALPTLLALFTALFATIAHILFRKESLIGFIAFCVLLSVSEYVRGYAFTGFPWNLYGYGWASVFSMIQSLSLIGPYGLTLLTIIWGCSFGYILLPNAQRGMGLSITILSMAVIFEYGFFRLKDSDISYHESLLIHIVQPNINQAEKWRVEQFSNNFDKHIIMSSNVQKISRNVFIWPETALPPSFLNSMAVQERVNRVLRGNSILLSGALRIQSDTQTKTPSYHNSLVQFQGRQKQQPLYDKSHLVPFGEYIPFQEYIPLKPVVAFTGFKRGNGTQTIQIDNYPSVSPLICYEIIFAHQAVNKKQERPDYILTVTNDAWYGDSPGPYQHFQQARFRAIEQGIPVVRSANTGISGLVGPYGRVIKQTELMEDAIISVRLPVKTASKTYFNKLGDLPYLIFSLIFLCWAGYQVRRLR